MKSNDKRFYVSVFLYNKFVILFSCEKQEVSEITMLK
ncbi:Uncharacterised protein [Streptococcus equi subsp. equi]|nr:Uncharacterised protein [Streptococcus equi subsp. equi]